MERKLYSTVSGRDKNKNFTFYGIAGELVEEKEDDNSGRVWYFIKPLQPLLPNTSYNTGFYIKKGKEISGLVKSKARYWQNITEENLIKILEILPKEDNTTVGEEEINPQVFIHKFNI